MGILDLALSRDEGVQGTGPLAQPEAPQSPITTIQKLIPGAQPAETIEEAFDALEMIRQAVYEGLISSEEEIGTGLALVEKFLATKVFQDGHIFVVVHSDKQYHCLFGGWGKQRQFSTEVHSLFRLLEARKLIPPQFPINQETMSRIEAIRDTQADKKSIRKTKAVVRAMLKKLIMSGYFFDQGGEMYRTFDQQKRKDQMLAAWHLQRNIDQRKADGRRTKRQDKDLEVFLRNIGSSIEEVRAYRPYTAE